MWCVSQIHFVPSAFSFFPFEIGKTSVSLALAHIFGFGHTQSDDIRVKNSAPAFIKKVVDLLRRHDVVIADKCVITLFTLLAFFLTYSYDRNNHLKQHRQSLRDVASKFPQSVRLLALNWSLDQPPATIHRICGDRVQERGDNHQTLRADMSSKSHEEIIWMFINSTQELTPNEVDNVVEMELGESMEDSVKRAVEGCVAVMGLEMPSDEKIQEGLNVVRGYAPTVKKPDDPKGKKKLDVRYYGLLAEVDLKDILDRAFANEPQTNKDFWIQLKTDRRVTKRPHVTIVHRNSIDTERELWDRCTALYEKSTTTPPLFKGTLSNLLWNDRVMAITLEDFHVDTTASPESQEGGEFVSQLPDEVRARLHITVGTGNGKILPVEAKTMVQQWRRGEELDKIKSIKLDNRIVYGRIKGLST
jgi:tRNA ligase